MFLLNHRWNQDLSDRGRIGDSRTGDSAEKHTCKNIDLGQAAVLTASAVFFAACDSPTGKRKVEVFSSIAHGQSSGTPILIKGEAFTPAQLSRLEVKTTPPGL